MSFDTYIKTIGVIKQVDDVEGVKPVINQMAYSPLQAMCRWHGGR